MRAGLHGARRLRERRRSGGRRKQAENEREKRGGGAAAPASVRVFQGSANTLMTPESFGIWANVPPKKVP
jgi:hypothetical protein